MEGAALQNALEQLAEADILLVQGLPPESEYRFKHALIKDAAYENLLKSRRQVLHRRVGEALRDNVATAAAEPELLARHFTQAGLTEVAIEWWGKAGHRSLERSALVEAAEQFTRALDQIATMPATPALRRERIKLQVALITPLTHVSGFAAPETKAAAEQAWQLITQADALGEPPDDALLRFSVLYSLWATNLVAFDGDAMRELSAQFLTAAEKQLATAPLMIGYRLRGVSLLCTGDLEEGRRHLDRSIALYNPVEHRQLATRFGQDHRVATLLMRSLARWMLGYPRAAAEDAERALEEARDFGHAATLMWALANGMYYALIADGSITKAQAELDELAALAGEKSALTWKASAMLNQGVLLLLRGQPSEAIEILTPGLAAYDATGATLWTPLDLSYLARAYAELGRTDDAWQGIGEATRTMETTKETWCEAEVHRIAGEIALKSPKPDSTKAQAYFEHALAVARQQQAKSWELRAAMSMARLLRDQGKRQQAHDLLAPIYDWFTEGFGTRDLMEAKALLGELVV